MFEVILPQSFSALLAAFQPCFTAPTYPTFRWLVAGWIHCLGRHTITGVAIASEMLAAAWEASSTGRADEDRAVPTPARRWRTPVRARLGRQHQP